ncbi:hypothetical protein GH714_027930 [Hevea brasiliensis]|uniref:Methyltransferase type 11 domain-containing protein n=1 Tax=Hevea brasiliensis TaxID=3981 RepID=A0A6A6MHT5_HEVBR|nr:hypothetical protein GH714_027930 [Hevea brasiliensis]
MITGTNLFQNRFLKPIWNSFECKEDVNLTTDVVRQLMVKQLLDYSAKALYVGEGSASAVYALRELGFTNACGAHRHPFFSLKHKKFAYELQYTDSSFDFVFSRDLDDVSVPAVLVLEIERVLKPGGIGAMLVGVIGLNANGLIRSATPVSSLLKASNVVHVSYVQEYALVVFQKRFEKVGYFQQFRLPSDCQSFMNNRPFMEHLEPLVEKEEMSLAGDEISSLISDIEDPDPSVEDEGLISFLGLEKLRNHVDDNDVVSKDCMDLLKSFRSSGMYVHQWWGD